MKYPSLTKPLLHTTFIAILSTLATPAVAHQAIVPVKNESGLTLASYETHNIQGWTVHIEKSALDHAKLKTALVALEAQLTKIKSFINPEIVTKLKAVPIWLNKKTPHTTCYHPILQWLKKINRIPVKALIVYLHFFFSFFISSISQPISVSFTHLRSHLSCFLLFFLLGCNFLLLLFLLGSTTRFLIICVRFPTLIVSILILLLLLGCNLLFLPSLLGLFCRPVTLGTTAFGFDIPTC